ncbi:30S ribosomal protein S31, mitochondrial-like [Canna indica]|uniref:30S ribosomal protein S31, mitochondrial-like n=1 Tax=Canna indica TaxID=4628 RepID=A0AAQ3PYW8_9LILI|nr:30S ribosomal protein S31, mitochondrial-like [Canna indica]
MQSDAVRYPCSHVAGSTRSPPTSTSTARHHHVNERVLSAAENHPPLRLWFFGEEAQMAMMWLARTTMQRLAQQHQPVARSFSSMWSAVSSDTPAAAAGFVVPCGRGDKKTKRGKRFKGSFGNARAKRKKMIQRIKDRVEVPRSTPWPLPFKLI